MIFTTDIFIGAVFTISNVISLIVSLIFAFTLVMCWRQKTEKDSELMYMTVLGVSALRIILSLLGVILAVLHLMTFKTWGLQLLGSVLGVLITAGGLYGLYYAAGHKFLIGKTSDELKAMIKEAFAHIQKESEEMFGKANKEPQSNASAAYTGESTAYNAPASGTSTDTSADAPVSETDNTGAGNAEDNATATGGAVPPPVIVMPSGRKPTERVKDNRSLLLYIVFTIFTCGIYGLYFIHALAKDVNTVCDGDGANTSGLLHTFVYALISCGTYNWYWGASIVDRLRYNASRYNVSVEETGLTYILWNIPGILLCFIGPFVAQHIIIKNMNKLAKAYNEYYGL